MEQPTHEDHATPLATPVLTSASAKVSLRTRVELDMHPTSVELVIGAPGPGDFGGLALHCPSTVELHGFLTRALAEVVAADPSLAPDHGPDPVLVEARSVIVDDIVARLSIEVTEISQADVRTARRMAVHAADLLDGLLTGDPVTPVRAA